MSIVLNGTTGITTPDLDSSDLTVTKAGTPIIADRTGSNGTILDLKKDGSTVGIIGGYGGQLIIGTGNTGLRFQNSIPAIIPRTTSDGASDGVYDLGDSNARFKDLYLSGGVYLGGTGSANKLDSYEEGTFTPTFTPDTSGSLPLQSVYDTMQYVKIGSWVTLSGFIRPSTPSSPVGSSPAIGNFPFTVADLSDASGRSTGSVSYFDDSAGNWSVLPVYIIEGQTQAVIKIDSSTIGNNDGFYVSFNYRTA